MRQQHVVVLFVLFFSPVAAVYGDLFSWGRGSDGALGLGNFKQQNRPLRVSQLAGEAIEFVSAGASSGVAVTKAGKVYMWGKGVTADGKLDPKGEAKSADPVRVRGTEDYTAITFTAGICHYVLLTDKGSVVSWGCNQHGSLGRGKRCDDCYSEVPQIISGLQGMNVRQLVSGGHHSAALTENGEVYVWGSGVNGEIGNGGFVDSAVPQRVSALADVRICQICSGLDHMGAIDTEGRVWTWGGNQYGQLGHGMNELRIATPRVVSRFMHPDKGAIIGCGHGFTSVITVSNKVFVWGAGAEPLPTEKTFFSSPSLFPRAVSAGRNHAVVVTKDYEVYSWGSNYQGQLGYSDAAFFTLEPQKIDELSGKYITVLAAGANHTFALSGNPAIVSTCPFFQDFYGNAANLAKRFTATCQKTDVTCPDDSCCRSGESCAQFSDGKWGCCAGPDMIIVDDDLTCCPKNTIFNSADHTCEKSVSFAEAAQVFKHFEDGALKKIDLIPAEIAENPGGISHEGENLNILDPSRAHSTTKLSESVYARDGLSAASDAIIGEYHKLAAEQAHAIHNAESAVKASAGTSTRTTTSTQPTSTQPTSTQPTSERSSTLTTTAETNVDSQATSGTSAPSVKVAKDNSFTDPKQITIADSTDLSSSPAKTENVLDKVPEGDAEGEEEDDEPTFSPEDLEVQTEIRQEKIAGTQDASKGGDILKMKRPEIVKELLTYLKADGKDVEKSEFELALMSDADLRSQLILRRTNAAATLSSTRSVTINEEGVPASGPFTDAIKSQELKQAQLVIKALENEKPHVRQPIHREPPDFTQTVEWVANTKLSERVAGVKRRLVDSPLQVDQPPSSDDGAVPGASFLLKRHGGEAMLNQIDATAAVSARPGSGPCPRSAGNLDCNRDCAEVDANVIDNLRAEDAADEIAAKDAYETIAAGFDRVLKTKEQLMTPTASVSPSPSTSWVSTTLFNKKTTLIQEGDLTVEVDSLSVHIPPSGYYRDLENSGTYKIIGDKVTSVVMGSKFVSLGKMPGTLSHGHCGASRPTCPDNSCCSEHETCCQQQDGSYGCCPFDTGSCCTDRRHCCPSPYSCDLQMQACVFNGTTVALARFDKVNQGFCEATQRACKDGSCCDVTGSCCQMYDGLQGCAPYPDAVCCSDGQHACPYGTNCNTKEHVCVDPITQSISPIGKLQYSTVPAGASKVCFPDEQTCLGGTCCIGDNTCCMSSEGYEECCPYTDGVCCAGGSCCPNGFECDNEKNICHGPDGQAPMKTTVPGRAPFLVAEVCNFNEYTCPGSHDPTLCCGKGSGCCTASVNGSNGVELIHGCCSFGEDAVCCDDGTCCPYRHICSDNGCVGPTGKLVSNQKIQPARPSEIDSSTASCKDSRQLQDKLDAKLEEMAVSVKENCTKDTSNKTMITTFGPKEDVGVWGNENQNAKIAALPGEAGVVHLDQEKKSVIKNMRERREVEQMVDLLEYLKLLLTQLARVKMNDLCTVQGELEFPGCVFDDKPDSKDTLTIRRSLAEAAEVEIEQIILSGLSGGRSDYMIDPIPDNTDQCLAINKRLKSSVVGGFLQSTLVSQNFTCAKNLPLNTKLPAVVIENPIDFNDKMNVIDNLHKLLANMYGDDFALSNDITKNIDGFRDIIDVLSSLRNQLNLAIRRNLGDVGLLMEEKTVISVLEQLLTQLLSFLKTNKLDLEALHLTKYKVPKLTDRIHDAHVLSKCERQQPDQPPGPGCETTNMALSSLPLRDLDSDRFDPVLQREVGLGLPSLSAVNSGPQQPPSLPVVDHVAIAASKPEKFWMPEACEGEGCKQ